MEEVEWVGFTPFYRKGASRGHKGARTDNLKPNQTYLLPTCKGRSEKGLARREGIGCWHKGTLEIA